MSAIHEQAMNYVCQQVLQRLIGHFTREERTVLQLLIQRIIVSAGGMEQIGDYKVLIAHGGGVVSGYTLALLRAAQLTIAGRSPRTFQQPHTHDQADPRLSTSAAVSESAKRSNLTWPPSRPCPPSPVANTHIESLRSIRSNASPAVAMMAVLPAHRC